MTTEPVQRKLQHIFDRYQIRPTKNFTFSYFSMGNEVFFVQDAKGRKLVLKNCLKNRSQVLLEVECALMDHLNANGCPTASVVPDKDGHQIVEQDGDWWIMTRHLNGHMPSWSTKLKDWHFSEAVRGLALYHKAVENFVPPHETGRIASWEHDRVLAWTENLASQLAADTASRASVARMQAIMGRYLAIARLMPSLLGPEAVERCAKTFIHGDFHCFNVVFRWQRFAACFDFDFIRKDLRLFDFTWSLRMAQRRFYRKKYGAKMRDESFVPPAHEVEELEYESLAWMYRTYTKTWPMPVEELALLPAFQGVMALYNLRFFDLANSESECLQHAGWYEWTLESIDKFGMAFENAVARLVSELGGTPVRGVIDQLRQAGQV